MATIKSFTSLEQAKKLAEILPLESADMLWEQHGAEPYVTIKPWTTIGKSIGCHCLSCWSLASLLNILPEIQYGKPVIALDDNYITYPHMSDLHTKADNLVDACYELILKLNKLKML